MAISNAADIGYGASITFSSSFFTQIIDMSVSGVSRTSVDISHFASTNAYRTFMPGDLKDPGELEVQHNFLTNALAAFKTAMAAASASGTITYPVPAFGGASAGTEVVNMFATNHSHTIPGDDRMVGTMTIKLSGEPTMTDAA